MQGRRHVQGVESLGVSRSLVSRFRTGTLLAQNCAQTSLYVFLDVGESLVIAVAVSCIIIRTLPSTCDTRTSNTRFFLSHANPKRVFGGSPVFTDVIFELSLSVVSVTTDGAIERAAVSVREQMHLHLLARGRKVCTLGPATFLPLPLVEDFHVLDDAVDIEVDRPPAQSVAASPFAGAPAAELTSNVDGCDGGPVSLIQGSNEP